MSMLAVKTEKKNFANPDNTKHFDKSQVDFITEGDRTLARVTLEPGFRWSESMKDLMKINSCETSHFQYIVSGRIHYRMDDGEEFELGPGDVATIGPGHEGWVLGDEKVVLIDMLGMKEYANLK